MRDEYDITKCVSRREAAGVLVVKYEPEKEGEPAVSADACTIWREPLTSAQERLNYGFAMAFGGLHFLLRGCIILLSHTKHQHMVCI
jgi:hypothetical protein